MLGNNTQFIKVSLKIMNNISLKFTDFSNIWCAFSLRCARFAEITESLNKQFQCKSKKKTIKNFAKFR